MATRLRIVTRLERVQAWFRWLELLAVLCGVGLLVAEYGLEAGTLGLKDAFHLFEIVVLLILFARVPITYFFADLEREGGGSWEPRTYLGKHLPARVRCLLSLAGVETLLALLAIALALMAPFGSSPGAWLQSVLRLALLSMLVAWLLRGLRSSQQSQVSPLVIFTLSYTLVVLAGALLLMLPRATEPGVEIGFVNAVFMSASASCVTGLSLYDIGSEFTLFGQLVILALIQIGGLGIMTFAAFAAIASGAGLSLKDRVAMGEVLNYDVVGKIGRLVLWILGITIGCEVIGVLMLYGSWVDANGVPLSDGQQWYFSIFHSISAFCNAGFSLHGDSLSRYGGVIGMVMPISLLVVLGGLGFTVLIDLLQYRPWLHPMARRLRFVGRYARGKALPRLKLHTKLVIVMSLGLTIFGTVGFWLLERDNTLAHAGASLGFWEAFFQGGITPRTAGFNTLDYHAMQPATKFFTILMMVIGASPGSTGGGLKTTAVAILLLALWNTFRGRPVEVFKRRVADDQIRRVLVLLFVALLVLNGAVFILTLTETEMLSHHGGFMAMTFEVVSAFATVGLSTGATPDFTDAGKMILALCMFFGRLGPLTLVLAIGRRRSQPYDFPTESVMIG